MFTPLKLRLGLEYEMSLRADHAGPRPSESPSTVAINSRRSLLCQVDPVFNDGKFTNTGETDTKLALESAQTRHTATCRHVFVKSRRSNLGRIGLNRCAVCQKHIWKFWKIQTCASEYIIFYVDVLVHRVCSTPF